MQIINGMKGLVSALALVATVLPCVVAAGNPVVGTFIGPLVVPADDVPDCIKAQAQRIISFLSKDLFKKRMDGTLTELCTLHSCGPAISTMARYSVAGALSMSRSRQWASQASFLTSPSTRTITC